jgi:hypothetical protein
VGHDLAKALGLDAVLVAYNALQAEKEETNVIGAYACMSGPNPVPDTGQKLYWTGHQYTGAWMKLDVPRIQTGNDSTQVDFDGSGIVARARAERTAACLEGVTAVRLKAAAPAAVRAGVGGGHDEGFRPAVSQPVVVRGTLPVDERQGLGNPHGRE